MLAFGMALAGCDSGTGPSGDGPRLASARYGAADPPPEGVDYLAQVAVAPNRIQADVLLRADIACSIVAAGLDAADTLLLVIETRPRAPCEPVSGGTLVESTITGIPDDPPPFRIEWWHGDVVDTVYQDGPD